MLFRSILSIILITYSSIFAVENVKFNEIHKNTKINVGEIVKVKGKKEVFVQNEGEHNPVLVKNITHKLFLNDKITTNESSKAYIKLSDKSNLVLDQKSSISIKDDDIIEQKGGEVYYDILKNKKRKLKIVTDFAVIEVKGTKYSVVDKPGENSVVLYDGKLKINSKNKDFIYINNDPRCGEFFTKNTSEIDIVGGESLDFENGIVYKQCQGNLNIKPKKYKDSFLLIFYPNEDSLSCKVSTNEFFIQAPKIISTNNGCNFTFESTYNRCLIVGADNSKEYKINKNGKKYILDLNSIYKNKKGFVQYKCYEK